MNLKEITLAMSNGTITKEQWQEETIGYQKYTGDNLRKAASFCEALVENMDMESTIDIQTERRKKQDAARDLNEKIRWLADHDYLIEVLKNSIEHLPPIEFDSFERVYPDSPQIGCLFLADVHYGAEFDIGTNKYSPTIVKERLYQITEQMARDPLIKDMDILKIYGLGDYVENILRMSSLTKMKIPVVDAVMEFAELMCNWLEATAKSLDVRVEFEMISGNHDQIRMLQSKPTFDEESFSKIIEWFIYYRLEGSSRVVVYRNDEADAVYSRVGRSTFVCVHEQAKNANESFRYYSDIYGDIDTMYCGHLHNYSVQSIGMNINGRDLKIVHVPSLIGSDPYAKKLCKNSRAGCHFVLYDVNEEIMSKNYWVI